MSLRSSGFSRSLRSLRLFLELRFFFQQGGLEFANAGDDVIPRVFREESASPICCCILREYAALKIPSLGTPGKG